MKRLLAQFILITDTDHVNWGDRIKYIWNAILHFAPIALVLKTWEQADAALTGRSPASSSYALAVVFDSGGTFIRNYYQGQRKKMPYYCKCWRISGTSDKIQLGDEYVPDEYPYIQDYVDYRT